MINAINIMFPVHERSSLMAFNLFVIYFTFKFVT